MGQDLRRDCIINAKFSFVGVAEVGGLKSI
jgi:hypothetical protein